MKKIIKLFIVCLLFVSVFTVNVKNVFAGKVGNILIRNNNDVAAYIFDSGEMTVDSIESTEGADAKLKALGMEVGYEYNNEESRYYATLTIKNDLSLHYVDDTDCIIEADMPIIIRKDPSLDENPILRFTGDFENVSLMRLVAISCEDSIIVEDINMSFFEELNGKSLRTSNQGDDESFMAFYCEGDYDPEVSYEPLLSINNSEISMFGTTFIDGYESDVYINDSSIKAQLMYPVDSEGNTTCFDYFDYEGMFIYAVNLEINNSKLAVNVNIPNIDQNKTPNPMDEACRYINGAIVEAEQIYIGTNSELIIKEPNYNYANGLKAEYISVSYGTLIIDGCINSIFYSTVDEHRGSYTSGVFLWNADFELTSLLTNVCMQDTKYRPTFAIVDTNDSSWHFDYMKVIGSEEDYKLYQTQIKEERIEYTKGFRSLDFYTTDIFDNRIYSEFSDEHVLKYTNSTPQSENDYNMSFNLSSTDDINNLVKTAKGIGVFSTVEPPAPASLSLNTHGHNKVIYADGKIEGDDYIFPGLDVSYDSENQTFKINVTKDCTLIKKPDDLFSSFIDSDEAGIEITGSKTLSFEVTYTTSAQEKANSTRCINVDASYMLKVSGDNNGKLKLVVKDKTDTSKTRTYNPVTTSLFFIPQLLYATNLQARNVQCILDNVDINSSGANYLFNSGGGNVSINNSNIVYKYIDPNFSNNRVRFAVSPFLISSSLVISNSNVELTGDKSLNQEGLFDYEAGVAEGGIIVNGDLMIKGCNGDKEICIKDFFVGIGSFGTIKISDSNIDVEGYHGGIGAAGLLSITHTNEDYIRIKSNEKSEIKSNFTLEGGKYPAVFSLSSEPSISTDSEHPIYTYDLNNNKEAFKPTDAYKYRYIEINGDAKKEEEQKEKEEHHSGGSGGHYVIPKTGIR